jgi:transmembrane sensor
MNDLDQLGRGLAGLQDRQLAALQQQAGPVSPALGEHLLRRTAERRRARRVAALTTVTVVLAAAGIVGVRFWPHAGNPTVASLRAEAGQRVTADALDLALAFDDGSAVVLASGASVRTHALGPASADLSLERGRATIHVVHTAATRWTVRAGGYAIAVTGTRFRVDWRPETGAFSLAVEEGSVLVSGGLLREPLAIRTGQSVSLEQGRVASPPAASDEPRPSGEAAPAPMEAPAPVVGPAALEPPSPAHRPSHHPTAVSWRTQAEAGHYRDALAEAERRGFESICREAGVADLLTLAEAARYAGRPERAEQSLKAVRARFGGSDDAAMAGFLLGRIAAENRRDHGSAARWFRAYLRERPSGRLNREAEGCLLESLAFMDRNTAREAARVYLQHYPTGPHADFARNLLGQ